MYPLKKITLYSDMCIYVRHTRTSTPTNDHTFVRHTHFGNYNNNILPTHRQTGHRHLHIGNNSNNWRSTKYIIIICCVTEMTSVAHGGELLYPHCIPLPSRLGSKCFDKSLSACAVNLTIRTVVPVAVTLSSVLLHQTRIHCIMIWEWSI